MLHIDWRPSPNALRRWAVALLIATALAGSLLRFLLGHQLQAHILWTFGALGFLTGLTGTRAALPFYYLWMGFVWAVSRILGTAALALVFFLVVTPIGLAARLLGRDRLRLRRPSAGSLWVKAPPMRADRFDRPF